MKLPFFAILRHVITGFVFICTSGSVAAQAPAIQWQHVLGGSQGEEATRVCQQADGGYILAGYTGSYDGDVAALHGTQLDFWIIKIDSVGNMLWQKTFGGTGSELGVSLAPTFDSGFIMAGYSFSNDGDVSGNHGNCDYWVVKVDDTGAIQWQRSLGGSAIDIAASVIQTYDSGYVVAGRSFSVDGDVSGAHDSVEAWIVKLSPTGGTIWQLCLGGSSGDAAYDVQQTYDSGLIIACVSKSLNGDVTGNHGDYDAWIVKLSSSGSLLWQRSLGGSGTDYANKILQTRDSGFIIVGSSNSADGDLTINNGGMDYWAVKLSQSGSIQWQRSFGGSADEYAYSVGCTADSGYIVAGITFSDDGDVTGSSGFSDMWLVKISSTGSMEWQQALGGSGYDGANCIIQASDSGYVVVGKSGSADVCAADYHGANDYWIVKLKDTMAVTGTKAISNELNNDRIAVAPNPASSEITIMCADRIEQLLITDMLGQLVLSQAADATQVQVSVAALPSGMYFVTVNNTAVTRFVKW